MGTQSAKPGNVVINVHINDVHYKLDHEQYTGADPAAIAGIPSKQPTVHRRAGQQ